MHRVGGFIRLLGALAASALVLTLVSTHIGGQAMPPDVP